MKLLKKYGKQLFAMAATLMLIGTSGLSLPVSAQTPAPTPSPSPTPAPSVLPPEVIQYAFDWPLPNKDYGNSRSTMNSPINSSSVSNLNLAWSYQLAGGASANPLILDRTVYFQDLNSNVIALSLDTGAVKWTKNYNLPNLGPNGPAAGWGKIFVSVGTSNITALDINTGNELWSTRLTPSDNIGTDIQPVVYDNTVYVSTAGGGTKAGNVGGNIGTIYALAQDTGKVKWSFDTVDSKDIWGNPQVNSGGGCYFPPAVDLASGTMYWGTANPAPYPGTAQFPNGSSRPGPNLYTDAMLALDHNDGSLKWFNQVYPHDLFNYSLAISPVLASANVSGTKQNIVIGTGKTGKVYAFNLDTGALLWEAVVGTHQNDQLDQLPPGTTRVYPGELGGVESCMAYAYGTLYVAVDDMYVDVTPSSYTPQAISGATGELVAIQVDTGKILWDKSFPSLAIGAATVVNDLVFTGTLDGNLFAFNRDTGEQVWNYKSPPGIVGWPAVSGDSIVFLGGANSKPALLMFKLSATPPPSPTPSPTARPAPTPSPTQSPIPSPTPSPVVAQSATPTPYSPSLQDLTSQMVGPSGTTCEVYKIVPPNQ